MYKLIKSKNIVNCNSVIGINIDVPHFCPHCSTAIDPIVLDSQFLSIPHKRLVVFVFCMCTKCKKAFISEYSEDPIDRKKYNKIATYPTSTLKPTHSKEISELSPRFVQIYNEAFLAEQSNLHEICGMGYRKAVEFLVKDFATKTHPDKEDNIKHSSLSQCINNYIDSQRIKDLALATVWIGNDETHYYRKHEDYSLESMKAFLAAMITFIDSELQAIKASELIQSHNG